MINFFLKTNKVLEKENYFEAAVVFFEKLNTPNMMCTKLQYHSYVLQKSFWQFKKK